MNLLLYHWHVQGVAGASVKATREIVALANQLYNFGHRTEERKLELWQRLSRIMDMLGVEQLLGRNQ